MFPIRVTHQEAGWRHVHLILVHFEAHLAHVLDHGCERRRLLAILFARLGHELVPPERLLMLLVA